MLSLQQLRWEMPDRLPFRDTKEGGAVQFVCSKLKDACAHLPSSNANACCKQGQHGWLHWKATLLYFIWHRRRVLWNNSSADSLRSKVIKMSTSPVDPRKRLRGGDENTNPPHGAYRRSSKDSLPVAIPGYTLEANAAALLVSERDFDCALAHTITSSRVLTAWVAFQMAHVDAEDSRTMSTWRARDRRHHCRSFPIVGRSIQV